MSKMVHVSLSTYVCLVYLVVLGTVIKALDWQL